MISCTAAHSSTTTNWWLTTELMLTHSCFDLYSVKPKWKKAFCGGMVTVLGQIVHVAYLFTAGWLMLY